MLTIESSPDGTILLHADGQLTVSDYAYGVEQVALLSTTRAFSVAGLLIDLGPVFTGWSVGALWRGSDPEGDPSPQPRRVAVIGDERWKEWPHEAAGFFATTPVRFFERRERAAAACWVRERDDAGAPD